MAKVAYPEHWIKTPEQQAAYDQAYEKWRQIMQEANESGKPTEYTENYIREHFEAKAPKPSADCCNL